MCFYSAIFGENEPSDAETLDSDSSGDESDDDDDVGPETEQTEASEEQVVPKSEKESFTGESPNECGSTNEFTTSDVFSKDPANSASSSICMERERKIDLLLYGRLLKQAADRNSKPSALGVRHSKPVPAQLVSVERSSVSVESIVSRSLTVTSSAGCLRSAAGNHHLTDGFQKPTVVSCPRDAGISAEMKSSSVHNVRLMTAATGAFRRIAPAFCGSVGTSASVAVNPAATAVVKVEPPEHAINETYVITDSGWPEQLRNHTFCFPSGNRQCESHRFVTLARPVVSKSSIVTDVGKHRESVDLKTPLGESFVTASLTQPVADIKPVVPASQCDVILPALNKPCQLNGSDLAEQMCSRREHASAQLPQALVTKMPDAATLSTGPAGSDNWYSRNLVKQTDSTPKLLDFASPGRQRTALNLRPGAASKKLLDRPGVATTSSESADDRDLRDIQNTSCLKAPCLNQTVAVSVSESVLCKVAGSVINQPLPGCCTFVLEEPSVSSVMSGKPAAPVEAISSTEPTTRSSETFTTFSGRCVPIASATFDVSDPECRQPGFVESCNDSNNNRTEGARASDTWLETATADGTVDNGNGTAEKKSPRRRRRGFAASSPLPDDSPTPRDASFGSLSSISLASDCEGCRSSGDEEAGDSATLLGDGSDEVMLLDASFASDERLNVAFVSDDQLQSATSSDTVSGTPRGTDSGSRKPSPLQSSSKSPAFRPLAADSGSGVTPRRAGSCIEKPGQLSSSSKSPALRPSDSNSCSKAAPHRTDSGTDKPHRVFTSKSPAFQPLTAGATTSSSRSRLSTGSGSRDCLKTGCTEPSSDSGSVVHQLRSRQTQPELLSASSRNTVTVAASHKTPTVGTVRQKSARRLSSPKFAQASADIRSTSRFGGTSSLRDRVKKTGCCEASGESGPAVCRQPRSKRTRSEVLSSSDDDDVATFAKQNLRSSRNTRSRLA